MKTNEMYWKRCNYISAVCFFLSSLTLLFMPLINTEDGFPNSAYWLPVLFWLGLIVGGALQILLSIKIKGKKVVRSFRKTKLISKVIFVVAILVLLFFKKDMYAVSISLFAMLLSIEIFCVVKQMEKIIINVSKEK